MKKHILYLGPMCFRCQEVTRSTMQNRQYKNDVFFVLRTHEKETLEGSFVDPKRFDLVDPGQLRPCTTLSAKFTLQNLGK